MKKLFILFISLLSTLFCTAQTRLVLYEEFTDEGCMSAPAIDSNLEVLLNTGSNPYRVNFIKFMTDYISGGPGPFFKLTQTIDSVRQGYYGVNYAPFGLLDGKQPAVSWPLPAAPSQLTQSMINAAAAVSSPFSMSVNSVFHSPSRTITITVKVRAVADYTDFGGHTILRTARCKTIDLNSSVLWNGEKVIKNVVRDMYPTASGMIISGIWHTGDSQTYTLSGPTNSEKTSFFYDMFATDSFAVAWIQNDSDKTVLQSAKEGLIPLIPTVINTVESNNSVKIWPDPASSTLFLTVNNIKSGQALIRFYDATGKLCYKSEQNLELGEHQIPVDISSLPVGIYISLINFDGDFITSKFAIIR